MSLLDCRDDEIGHGTEPEPQAHEPSAQGRPRVGLTKGLDELVLSFPAKRAREDREQAAVEPNLTLTHPCDFAGRMRPAREIVRCRRVSSASSTARPSIVSSCGECRSSV